jgi:hypothetical protein
MMMTKKKNIWVIELMIEYQIIVTEIFQKNKHIIFFSIMEKTGIEALIHTILWISFFYKSIRHLWMGGISWRR